MTAPPWGHKPPAVPDRYTHWGTIPPEPSARMTYWVMRWRAGWWQPNRWVWREGYDARAGLLGVWIWESNNVLAPMAKQREGAPEGQLAARILHGTDRGAVARYWRLLEERSRQDCRDDLIGILVNAIEEAQ